MGFNLIQSAIDKTVRELEKTELELSELEGQLTSLNDETMEAIKVNSVSAPALAWSSGNANGRVSVLSMKRIELDFMLNTLKGIQKFYDPIQGGEPSGS